MNKIWNNQSIKQAIKDSLSEEYFFNIEDIDAKQFLLTNQCETPQTFLVTITELESDEIKYFKLVKEMHKEIHKIAVEVIPELFHEKENK